MRKLFGQYLVERGLISEEELLKVLMEQRTRVPPLHEILYKNRILPTTDLIRAFAYQQENDVGFKTALKELKLWTRRVSDDVDRRIRNYREPIGQILVRSERVTFADMNKVLEDFLKEKYRDQGRGPSLGEIPAEVDLSPAESMDSELLKECAQVVSNILESDLSERLQRLAQTGIYDEELCDSISVDIHRIKAAMNFVGANINASFANIIEKTFSYLANEDGFVDWAELTDLIVRGLAVITDFTKDLLVTQTETSGFDKFGEIEDVSNELRQMVLTRLEIGQNHKVLHHSTHEFKILLIDPSKSVHRYFVHCLAGHTKFGALSALDWAEGRKKLGEKALGGVVVERNLALSEKIIPAIRAKLPDVPIVLLTSRTTTESKLDVTACLKKPFDESDLLATLSRIVTGAGQTAA